MSQILRAENARLRAERDIYCRVAYDIEARFGGLIDVLEVIQGGEAKVVALTSPCPGFEIEDGTGDYSGCIAAERPDQPNDCPACGSDGGAGEIVDAALVPLTPRSQGRAGCSMCGGHGVNPFDRVTPCPCAASRAKGEPDA